MQMGERQGIGSLKIIFSHSHIDAVTTKATSWKCHPSRCFFRGMNIRAIPTGSSARCIVAFVKCGRTLSCKMITPALLASIIIQNDRPLPCLRALSCKMITPCPACEHAWTSLPPKVLEWDNICRQSCLLQEVQMS